MYKYMEKTLLHIFTSSLLEHVYIGNLFRIIDIQKINGTDGYFYIRFDYADNTYDLFKFKSDSIRDDFFKSYSSQFQIFKIHNQSKNKCFH